MKLSRPKGTMFRCPVCGAEITVVAFRAGEFCPRCCNVPMIERPERARFFRCPVCGAEIAAVVETEGCFEPRCCNCPMEPEAA